MNFISKLKLWFPAMYCWQQVDHCVLELHILLNGDHVWMPSVAVVQNGSKLYLYLVNRHLSDYLEQQLLLVNCLIHLIPRLPFVISLPQHQFVLVRLSNQR